MTYRLMDGIEFLKSLPNKSVDGIFTDPPWGIKVGTHAKGHRTAKLMNASRWTKILTEMTNEGSRVLKDNGRCLIWLGLRHVGGAIKAITALEYRWMIFCYHFPPLYLAGFEAMLDPILYFALPEAPWPQSKPHGSRRIRAIYQKINIGKPDTMHPCARPFHTVKDILKDWFNEGEYVIDPFAGSDTTGVASRGLGLKWDSCEIDPKMYETGIERHRQQGLFE